jgi:hypothetical protein
MNNVQNCDSCINVCQHIKPKDLNYPTFACVFVGVVTPLLQLSWLKWWVLERQRFIGDIY